MASSKSNAAQLKWQNWHDNIKRELKNLLSSRVRTEKTYHIGREMKWGHLDSYKPDVAWEKADCRVFFEAEYWYEQAKIIEDITCASILGVDNLVFIFSNELDSDSGWDGSNRVQAAEYMGEVIGQLMSKPLVVTALAIDRPNEIKQKLVQTGIL